MGGGRPFRRPGGKEVLHACHPPRDPPASAGDGAAHGVRAGGRPDHDRRPRRGDPDRPGRAHRRHLLGARPDDPDRRRGARRAPHARERGDDPRGAHGLAGGHPQRVPRAHAGRALPAPAGAGARPADRDALDARPAARRDRRAARRDRGTARLSPSDADLALRSLRFYFDYLSTNAYVAWTQLPKLSERFGVEVEPVPVLFAGLLGAHGQLGPAEVIPKAIWMAKNNLRKAALLGVPLNPPRHHPWNPLLSLRISSLPLPEPQRRALI